MNDDLLDDAVELLRELVDADLLTDSPETGSPESSIRAEAERIVREYDAREEAVRRA